MRSKSLLFVILAALCIASVSTARPVAAKDGGDPPSFYSIGTDCELLDPGTEEAVDGVVQVRGLTFGGYIESDNDLFAGTSVVVVNADFNEKTGLGKVWVDGRFYPSAVAGYWEAPGVSIWGNPAVVRHSGVGKGALEGYRIQFSARPLPDGHPDTPPCAEPLNVLENRGVILPPNGSQPAGVEAISEASVSLDEHLFLPTLIR